MNETRPSDPLIGTVVGEYLLEKQLGVGGMGVVYAARHKTIQKWRRAVKLIHPQLAAYGDFAERFVREAEVLERLSHHPNLCRLHHLGEHEGRFYMVMDLLEGRSLDQLDHRDTVASTQSTVDWLSQACRGLAEAHAQGIVHRDLKPSNIFLTAEGKIVVLDFGIAHEQGMTTMTQAGSTPGTPAYIAPELLKDRNKRATAAADIYALGLTFYEVLAGVHPFADDTGSMPNLAQAVVAHVSESIPPIRQVRPDAPAWLEAILKKAIAKEPADRFENAGAMLAAIESSGSERAIPGTRLGIDDPPHSSQSGLRAHPAAPTPAPHTDSGAGGSRASWLLPAVIGGLVVAGAGGAIAVFGGDLFASANGTEPVEHRVAEEPHAIPTPEELDPEPPPNAEPAEPVQVAAAEESTSMRPRHSSRAGMSKTPMRGLSASESAASEEAGTSATGMVEAAGRTRSEVLVEATMETETAMEERAPAAPNDDVAFDRLRRAAGRSCADHFPESGRAMVRVSLRVAAGGEVQSGEARGIAGSISSDLAACIVNAARRTRFAERAADGVAARNLVFSR